MIYVNGSDPGANRFDADIVISFADADNAQGTEALAQQVANNWPDQKHLAERIRELEQQLAQVSSGNVAIQIRGLEKGWVSGFEFILREFVEQILGKSVEIELCSESASREAHARVQNSAVLLSVASPASIDERILQGHVDSFVSGPTDEVAGLPTTERAFAVVKQTCDSPADHGRIARAPVDFCDLPASIDNREFLKRAHALARDVADVLRSMRPVEATAEAAAPEESQAEVSQVFREELEQEFGSQAKQDIEEKRPDESPVAAGDDPKPEHSDTEGPHRGGHTETAPALDVATRTSAQAEGAGEAEPVTDSSDEQSAGYIVYVDYDRRDRPAARAVAGYLEHLRKKGEFGLTVLKPHWRSEVENGDDHGSVCEHCGREHCGRESVTQRIEEQTDIDLGFLKRVRQAHVTLVVFSKAGTEWAEERQAKIIQFDTDPRETPGIASVESRARAVYVHLPGQEHKRQRDDMKDWTQPYIDQFTQLPKNPSDSLQPQVLDDFLAGAQVSRDPVDKGERDS